MMWLAIDPGNALTTMLLYEPGETVAESRVPHVYRDLENQEVLSYLYGSPHMDAVTTLLIEDIESFGLAVGRTVFETARWSGRFQEAALHSEVETTYVTRTDCKLELCLSRRAKDSDVRRALIDLWGKDAKTLKGTKKEPGPLYRVSSHAWSALAVAATHHIQEHGG